MDKFAAIDLGTNTFHILIVEQTDTFPFFKEIYRQRSYVFLGKSGVEIIEDSRYQLGLSTLKSFKSELDNHDIKSVKVIGTEALRKAINGQQFIADVKKETGLKIEVIDGLKEAEYIYNGIISYQKDLDGINLIMDIGGGSVEFIIFDKTGLLWAQSFQVGVSVLHHSFQKNDPLTFEELDTIDDFLSNQLELLIQKCNAYNISNLIGSAGSFEIIKSMLENVDAYAEPLLSTSIIHLYDKIKTLDFDERLALPGLPPERNKLMPIALHLLCFVLQNLNIKTVAYSPYSMKEGIIRALIADQANTSL